MFREEKSFRVARRAAAFRQSLIDAGVDADKIDLIKESSTRFTVVWHEPVPDREETGTEGESIDESTDTDTDRENAGAVALDALSGQELTETADGETIDPETGEILSDEDEARQDDLTLPEG